MTARPRGARFAAGRFAAVGEVLANRGMRRIEAAWALGVAADGAFLVGLLLVAFAAGGPLAVGIVGVARMAPSIVAGPLAGIPAARFAPTRLLLGVHLVRGTAAIAATGWLVADGPLAGVVALAAVSATAGALVRPIQVAAMPSFAKEPGELIAANVTTSIGEGVGAFVGPLVASGAVAVAGPPAAAVAGSVLFVGAVVALVGLPANPDEQAEHEAARGSIDRRKPTDAASAGRSIAAAPAALRAAPGAATVFVGFSMQVFVRGLSTALAVVASIELLGMGEAGVGVLSAAYGLGGLAGAAASTGLAGRESLGRVFAVSLAFWGLPLAVVGAAPNPLVAVASFLVSGVANGILDVAGFTLLQRGVPTSARAPVFGLLEAMVGAGMSAGSLAVPILLAAFGSRGALAISGAILPVLAVASWPRLVRADEEVVLPERQLGLLRGIPFFARLPMTALERIAGDLRPVAFGPADVIMAEGEPADGYLVIGSGTVDVTIGGRLVNRCRSGEGIGEIGLVRSVDRTATVTATVPTEGYWLSSEDFLAAIAGPTSAAAAATVAAERLARSPEGAPQA